MGSFISANAFNNLSARRKLFLIISVWTLGLLIELVLIGLTLDTLSAVRASARRRKRMRS